MDTASPDKDLIRFAFEAALRRGTSLRIVHGWYSPPYWYGVPIDAELYGSLSVSEATDLTDALRPWRQNYPDVEVAEVSHPGSAAQLLVTASQDHSTAPVAVGAHD